MGLRFSKCWVYLKVGFSEFFLFASLKRGFVNIFSQKGTLIFFSIKMASSAGVLSEIRGGEGDYGITGGLVAYAVIQLF